MIEDQVKQKVDKIFEMDESQNDYQIICKVLIQVKEISINIGVFKENLDKKISKYLAELKKKDGSVISKLGQILQSKEAIGQMILQEHSIFEGFNLSLFNEKIQKLDINYVLEKIKGDEVDVEILKRKWEEYEEQYLELIQQNLQPMMNLSHLYGVVRQLVGKQEQNKDRPNWDLKMREKVPKLLAYIFALWTLENSSFYFEAQHHSNNTSYLFKPHAAQVISIFRILGIGYTFNYKKLTINLSSDKLQNNLIQIHTGEGKSITLAITSIVLALFGFNVSCACYSSYLSKRDYNAFKTMFSNFQVINQIKYGTFIQICEHIINQYGDVREIVINTIQGQKFNLKNQAKINANILLIDEVDVFFSSEFYGKNYIPLGQLKDPTITQLINYIWLNRNNNNISYQQIIETEEFQIVSDKFKDWKQLIQEAVKNLIYDVKNYSSQEYIVQNDKIGYKEQDEIVFNISYGYKTLFAYYHEFSEKNISESSLNENIGIEINCGAYSYAEIPKQFNFIMGVTGTLQTLSSLERDIVQNEYKIVMSTYMPSVFGENQFTFYKQRDIKVENCDNYFNVLKREIEMRMIGTNEKTLRAILVFFENDVKLMNFLNSKSYKCLKEKTKILTERAQSNEKQNIINVASLQGSITFLTRCYGRGTDIIAKDEVVEANGGIHVIQTFLSEEYSEEVQIKGRTARQGGIGSYSLVLLDNDLEKFLISNKDLKHNQSFLYDFIHEKRIHYFLQKYHDNKECINKALKLHTQTIFLLDHIRKSNIDYVKTFLFQQNKGFDQGPISRTIILLDGTGSMSNLFQKTKNTIEIIFENSYQILKQNDYSEGCFEILLAIYRNYNVREELLLENSGWETKSNNLKLFMDKVKVAGGLGEEAVEIGFQFANQQNEIKPITQVILIGDAPAQSAQQVIDRRNKHTSKEKYWKLNKFTTQTDYLTELDKLVISQIPVHGCYVDNWAKNCFEQISKKSAGVSCFLDVNSENGSQYLQDIITKQVLMNVGKKNGLGQQMVRQYEEMQRGHRNI